MKNKNIGSKVILRKLNTEISPETGWVTQKKVPATIISKEGLEHYWTTCSGGHTYVHKHIIKDDCYPTIGIKLDNGLTDNYGNNEFIVREHDIIFLETLPRVIKPVTEEAYKRALRVIERYKQENK